MKYKIIEYNDWRENSNSTLKILFITAFSYGVKAAMLSPIKNIPLNYSPYHWSLFLLDNLIEIYEAISFDVAQGWMNGAPNETRTHSWSFSNLGC